MRAGTVLVVFLARTAEPKTAKRAGGLVDVGGKRLQKGRRAVEGDHRNAMAHISDDGREHRSERRRQRVVILKLPRTGAPDLEDNDES